MSFVKDSSKIQQVFSSKFGWEFLRRSESYQFFCFDYYKEFERPSLSLKIKLKELNVNSYEQLIELHRNIPDDDVDPVKTAKYIMYLGLIHELNPLYNEFKERFGDILSFPILPEFESSDSSLIRRVWNLKAVRRQETLDQFHLKDKGVNPRMEFPENKKSSILNFNLSINMNYPKTIILKEAQDLIKRELEYIFKTEDFRYMIERRFVTNRLREEKIETYIKVLDYQRLGYGDRLIGVSVYMEDHDSITEAKKIDMKKWAKICRKQANHIMSFFER
jgi:hypothetical protein